MGDERATIATAVSNGDEHSTPVRPAAVVVAVVVVALSAWGTAGVAAAPPADGAVDAAGSGPPGEVGPSANTGVVEGVDGPARAVAPFYDVRIERTNSPVAEGETLTVEATVANTGNANDTQTVNLTVGGVRRDSTTVRLAPGENRTVTLRWATDPGDAGDYTANVSSEDTVDSARVAVREPANFAVTVDATNSPVEEGENLSVLATVENVGDSSDTQTIDLDIDGANRGESETVSLAAGESTNVTLNWSTGLGDRGEYTAYVNSSNDSDSERVTVQEPPTYNVDIDSTNSPVVEGENLSVRATITNTGSAGDNRTVDLTVDGAVRDSKEVSLSNGESETVTLNWTTRTGDAGEYIANVTSDDDIDSTRVTVEEDSTVPVTIEATNSPVVEGESLSVRATVTNTGNRVYTRNVTLEVNDSVGIVDRVDLALAPGESRTVTLNWTTRAGDAGPYAATVATGDDNDTTWVTVAQAARFDVTLDGTNSPVVEGDALRVEATITNTGDVEDFQNVTLTVGGVRRDVETVSLAPGGSTTTTLTWATAAGDDGTYTATVASANDSESAAVEVGAPANFTVSIDATNQPIGEGGVLTVTATITNEGDVRDNQTVSLDVNSSAGEVDATSVTLSGGATETVTLEWNTGSGDNGTYTATVASANDSDDRYVAVQQSAFFAVTVDSTNSPVPEGDALAVTARVTNVGDVTDTQNVTLAVNGTQVDTGAVTLAGDETRTVTLNWTTGVTDAGNYTARIATANDTDATAVRVVDSANASVTVTSTNSPVVEGETLAVNATVENTGDVADTREVSLVVNGTVRDSRSVTLAAGESTVLTLTWATAAGDAGDYTAEVATANDTDRTTVRVLDAPYFAVQVDATNSPVAAGDVLTVDATVTNTGEVGDTQEVTLAVDGTLVDSEVVSLAAGETTALTLTWATGDGDGGSYTAEVATANDTGTTAVTVGNGSPTFAVTVASANDPVVEGTDVEVTARVENTGAREDTQTVSLAVGGTEYDAREVTLSPGGAETVTLTWSTRDANGGDYAASVSSANDTDETTVTVRGDADFAVRVDGTNAPVTAGEDLVVDVTVRNTGDVSATRAVELLAPAGTARAERTLTLDPGERGSLTLRWSTTAGDAGEYVATVRSPDDRVGTGVTVRPRTDGGDAGSLRIGSVSTNGPVVESERVAVEVTLVNEGDGRATRTVELAVDGTVRDDASVTVDPGSDRTVTLYWATEAGDAGEYEATVATDDDTARTTVGVNAPSGVTVTVDGTNAPVEAGETLRVNATVGNDADVETTERVVLAVGGEPRATRNVTLAGGEARTVTLAWETADGDGGEYAATVTAGNASDGTAVTVREPATFAVSVRSVDRAAARGEEVAVTATVTNEGTANATRTVEYRVGGETVDEQSVTLAGGASTNVTFAVDAGDLDPGNYTQAVATGDDRATADLTVERSVEATDPDGDGLYEDVDGDGAATLADARALEDALDSPRVRDDPAKFDFDGDGDVDADDVCALREDLGADCDGTTTTAEPTTASPTTGTDPSTRTAPTAAFDVSTDTPDAGEELTLDASASTPADGESIARYEWDFDGDGDPEATGERVTHAFETQQIQVVTLTVVDGDGEADTAERRVFVSEGTDTPAPDRGDGPDGTETRGTADSTPATTDEQPAPVEYVERAGESGSTVAAVTLAGGLLLVLFVVGRYRLYRYRSGSPGPDDGDAPSGEAATGGPAADGDSTAEGEDAGGSDATAHDDGSSPGTGPGGDAGDGP